MRSPFCGADKIYGMNKLLYISTGIPKEEVDRLREKQYDFSSNALLPISVFHGNILSGLAGAYDEVCALSGVPIGHHNYKVLHYVGRQIQHENIRYVIPGFLNLPGIKQLTTVVKLWWHIFRWCIANRKHNCHILIDGTFYTGLLPLWLTSRFSRVKTGAILVDYYPFMNPAENSLSAKFYRRMLRCIDRFVFVTDHLEKLVNREHKDFMIMEGLVASSVPQSDTESVGDYCVYAGGLHEIYGVRNLVDAFHRSSLSYSLHLYGNGELVNYIHEVGQQDPRIIYKGIVPHDALLEIERSAKLLINPRPVYGKLDTRFNFPSKLMEYMQSGRPVITTKLLGIPEEYREYMYFFDGDTVEDILRGVENTLALDEKELATFSKKAQAYVNENKNCMAIGTKLFTLMNK